MGGCRLPRLGLVREKSDTVRVEGKEGSGPWFSANSLGGRTRPREAKDRMVGDYNRLAATLDGVVRGVE